MALPEEISTCALTVGPLADFAGDSYTLKVEWQPVLDGNALAGNVRSITWEATGLALASFSEKDETNTGGTITANLPHVDQPGFIDGSGDAFTGWTYRVKVTARDASRKVYNKTKYIAPLVGQATADFDLIPDGTVGVPVSSPSPVVLSVNNQTGNVTVPDAADVTEALQAAEAAQSTADAAAPATTVYDKATADGRFLRTGAATIIDIGHSIASNGVLSYYDRTASGLISFSPNSYMGWASPKFGGRFRCMGVAAAGGFHMENIISTLLDAAVAAGADYAHINVFTNNISGIITGTQTFDAARALYMTIVDAFVEAGTIPIIAAVPPIDSFSTGASLTVMTEINTWLHELAGSRGWPWVDYYSALVNPATNQMVAAYTTDGVHMTSAGAKVMGDALVATMASVPTTTRTNLAPSYNPNLMQPDAVFTSAAADKWVGSGNTSGGWGYRSAVGPMWKGNSFIISRGSAGDYGLLAPIDNSLWVVGHRVRLAFQLDASLVPASGTWSAYLYNSTQFQVIAGFSAFDSAMTNKSLTILAGTTTNASPIISAAAGTFKPEHVGCGVSSVNPTGLVQGIPANTVIRSVSADGTQAYLMSASTGAPVNATATVAGTAHITVSGPQPVAVFEFDVQPDMPGDTFRLVTACSGATGTTLNVSQVTLQDLTALEAA